MKQGEAEEFFQLKDLTAASRLLEALGNFTHHFTDPAMARHVVEQFQMVNVQGYQVLPQPVLTCHNRNAS